jgi:hypothetical protein
LFHFGFTLCANNGLVRVDARPEFFTQDSLRNVKQDSFPGIGLGAISNLRLGSFWDLRLMFPVIQFVQRNLNYEFANSTKAVKIESAYCEGSLLLKYKSARRKNVRAYVIGGLRASYDLSSTVDQKRGIANPVVSLVPFTTGFEGGFGLDIYFEYFKFSPEIKLCKTFGSALHREGYIYTNALYGLSPEIFVISLHFE